MNSSAPAAHSPPSMVCNNLATVAGKTTEHVLIQSVTDARKRQNGPHLRRRAVRARTISHWLANHGMNRRDATPPNRTVLLRIYLFAKVHRKSRLKIYETSA